jgi:hypothetical protein
MFSPHHHTHAQDNGVAVDNSGSGTVNVFPTQSAAAVSSLLNPLLLKIVEAHTPYEELADDDIEYPGVEAKLEYNQVLVFSDEIRENSGYMELIEGLIISIDDEDPGAQKKFLYAISQKYKEAKKELFLKCSEKPQSLEQKLSLIRLNSDALIKLVSDRIVNVSDQFQNCPVELVESAKQLIVCYGFINCKILEPIR